MEHPIIINAISKPINPLKVCITIGMHGFYLPNDAYTIEFDGLVDLRNHIKEVINSVFWDISPRYIKLTFDFNSPFGVAAVLWDRGVNTAIEVFEADEDDCYLE